MSARYVPPFGTVGRVIDRAALSRVAEATLKDFLDRVAEAIMRTREVPARAELGGASPHERERVGLTSLDGQAEVPSAPGDARG